eukprot:TRINITY_DN189_c0_g1_i8.p2 TRINITY_DN189_c0_g1~~TRINITY_DN189_c0_g1_i8.p2  ORF type:complete len:116 (-),score=28.97 TRINITY_DN189_c0_g1_i8:184-531(-)
MCIRDRYQRRVHGVNNKKIQNNQSITYFISQQTMYGSIFEFIKPFKPDGPAPAFKVISERVNISTTNIILFSFSLFLAKYYFLLSITFSIFLLFTNNHFLCVFFYFVLKQKNSSL